MKPSHFVSFHPKFKKVKVCFYMNKVHIHQSVSRRPSMIPHLYFFMFVNGTYFIKTPKFKIFESKVNPCYFVNCHFKDFFLFAQNLTRSDLNSLVPYVQIEIEVVFLSEQNLTIPDLNSLVPLHVCTQACKFLNKLRSFLFEQNLTKPDLNTLVLHSAYFGYIDMQIPSQIKMAERK